MSKQPGGLGTRNVYTVSIVVVRILRVIYEGVVKRLLASNSLVC